jgi:hypothetical protein
MAKQIINIGTAPNTGTGDPLRTAFTKINDNFEDIEFSNIELTNVPFVYGNTYAGDPVTFTKEDYSTGEDATDEIDNNLAITRDEQRGIYNPYLEPFWDDTTSDSPSPINTLWNTEGWGDLTDLSSRRYYSFYHAYDGNIGNNILGSEPVMYDVRNNKYYKFEFTVWGNAGDGAPVTYTRTQIDPVTGEEIGDPVTFEKPGYEQYTYDYIDNGLTLARGNRQGLYNSGQEDGWSPGDGRDSPEGTLWNSSGWGDLRDVTDRAYTTFRSALNNQIGNNIVGKELIMWDTINNKYWTIKFTSWTQGGNGGGFSYTRQLINAGLFNKNNYGSEVDVIVPDAIGITRGNNQGIYNPYEESGWNSDVSPAGTLWNSNGWNDLRNLTTRFYTNFYSATGGQLGNNVVGKEYVLYIPTTNTYYAVKFISWTQGGNGGGFSYVRREIDLSKLEQGIIFANGTVMTSADQLVSFDKKLKLNTDGSLLLNNKTIHFDSNENIIIGEDVEGNNIGYQNIIIGYGVGKYNNGSENIMIGYDVGKYNTGHDSIIIGTFGAGERNTGYNNIIIGERTGQENVGNDNIMLGEYAGQRNTGNDNTMFGYNAGQRNTGHDNIMIGDDAGQHNTGNNNIMLGDNTGQHNTGEYNILLGYSAGRNIKSSSNILLGRNSGKDITTGANNTIIGEMFGTEELSDTVLIASGDQERIRVDNSGMSVNGSHAINRVDIPATSIGTSGDVSGLVAFNSTYFYYCIADYDGETNIWKRVSWNSETW